MISIKTVPTIVAQTSVLLAVLISFTGCNSIPKRYRDAPVPEELVNEVIIPDIPDANPPI